MVSTYYISYIYIYTERESKVADYINSFFTSIGPNLAKNHDREWEFLGNIAQDECSQFRTDFREVFNLCKNIITTKSSGISDISSKIFKDAFLVLVPQLVYMFNLSFESGVFPDKWKEATVIPLFKGGNKNDVGNFRPVSLLPIPGKIIEKVVHSKLSSFLEPRDVISPKQGGFRKGFSTASSVADLTDRLFSNINNNLSTMAVFVDLRKAFDTVDHNILTQKLDCYGIRGGNLDWCKDYLKCRVQKTFAIGRLSESSAVKCGVPQGSVLGPMFFILYVNDMQHAIQGSDIQLYADDTVIYSSGSSAEDAASNFPPNLNKFAKWCSSNKLSLNVKKTKLMAFGTQHKVKKSKSVKMSIDGKFLQQVPTYKNLGIVLDSTLTYRYHVNSVIHSVLYKTNVLSQIRKFLTEPVALEIYKTMILPYFDYGDVIYTTANLDGLDKLQRLQNRCLKICENVHNRYNADALHQLTNCPKLSDRRCTHVNNFMYGRKSRKSLLDNRDIRTRVHDAPLFKVQVPKKEAYKRSVKYSGAVQWNSLLAEVRNIENMHSFKHLQKRKLI